MRAKSWLAASAAALSTGVLYQQFGTWRDAQRYPAPGRLVQIGRRRIHWNQQGTGRPLVILEAGLSATSLSWTPVQEKVAQFTSVASYDRAGLGWSDRSGDERPSVFSIISDLHRLVQMFSGGRRVILVGHSFGGLLVLAYARLFPEHVAALLLLDPVSVEQWVEADRKDLERLRRGAQLAKRGALLAELGLVRLCLSVLAAGYSGLPRLVARTVSTTQGLDLVARLTNQMRRLPEKMLPLVKAHWSRGQSFRVLARYLQALPSNARSLKGVRLAPRIPLTILSAGTASPEELRERDRWAADSDQGRHVRLPEGGHWLQLDLPDKVSAAIQALVADVT